MAKHGQDEQARVELLERGELAFIATPRVRPLEADDPPHPREVQRLYLILAPEGKERYRRILVGKNRLPEGARQRFWACVDRVGSIGEVAGDLGELEYDTKTRGPRRRPPGRALAEGTYAIVRHGDHVHFTYRVDDPFAPPDVLRALRIEPQASYVVAAFNPAAPPRLGAPDRRMGGAGFAGVASREGQKAAGSIDAGAPDWVLSKFGSKRFAPLDLDLFDAEGLEIVLMSGRHPVPAMDVPPQSP